jgi:hypothetical protein
MKSFGGDHSSKKGGVQKKTKKTSSGVSRPPKTAIANLMRSASVLQASSSCSDIIGRYTTLFIIRAARRAAEEALKGGSSVLDRHHLQAAYDSWGLKL